ncbi:hypothetical protein IFM89_001833 [Coptis chinensis]|uniref:Bulb-type lectin domain-containing protein n=1 Tax=Coptis chinensis TaxID=261450 RepID=A0A835LPB8_9MAGN|nr:hypothetical protein IFM89_001833 [Coptis chinensis]
MGRHPVSQLIFSLAALALVAESSSPFNITLGSSISTEPNQTSYWLSPSTNFAFGFFPMSSEYIIGIWLARTKTRTLVWAANHDHSLFSDSYSSVVFNHDGFFMVHSVQGKKAKPLFNVNVSASYAMLHDNGNFVMYGLDSNVIWQSFDYPTDTILVGQALRPGHSLMSKCLKNSSNGYKLSMQQDGNAVIYDVNKGDQVWNSATSGRGSNISLNLDSNGHLNLRYSVIIKNFTNGEERFKSTNGSIMYRSTLESDGIFRLYKERIGNESESSLVIWNSSTNGVKSSEHLSDVKLVETGCFGGAIAAVAVFLYWIRRCCNAKSQEDNTECPIQEV